MSRLIINNGVIKNKYLMVGDKKIGIINKIIIPKKEDNKHNVRTMIPMDPEGVCIHNTANSTATALNHATYFKRVEDTDTAYIGAHIFIDDEEIVQTLPLNEKAWHAGDGSNGIGNSKYIALELCENGDYKTTNAIAKVMAASLLAYYKKSSLKKHQDFSGKYCPRVILSKHDWEVFSESVTVLLSNIENTDPWKLSTLYELGEEGFIDVDYWINKLDQPAPMWAVLEIIKDVNSKINKNLTV